MGIVDELTKEFLQENEVFADVINVLLFDGKEVVKARELSELDTAEGSGTKRIKGIQKRRDVLKVWQTQNEKEACRVIFGIEHQAKIHPAMPLRIEIMNALHRDRQLRQIAAYHKEKQDLKGEEYIAGFSYKDKVDPIETVVVYTGEQKWKGEMKKSGLIKKWAKREEEGEEMALLQMYHVEEEEQKKYKSSMRVVLKSLMYSQDREKLIEYSQEEEMRHCDNRAARLIGQLLKIEVKQEEGETDMCKAIMEIREMGREEGKLIAVEESAKRMIGIGLNDELIGKCLDMPIEKVKEYRMRLV